MDIFKVFAETTDGTTQLLMDGKSANVLVVGDEIKSGGLVFQVLRRQLAVDLNPPEFHLFAERIA